MYNPKNEMFVKMIKDSYSDYGRIVTFHARYPRIIHGEVMTHRLFSRNARSSRAVPVKTIIQEVIDKPFIPWHWGKNQKGMQASEENNSPVFIAAYDDNVHMGEFSREDAWLWARNQAVEAAQGFANAEYHKQLANRILEPYSWIDTLITTTDLSNFYHLRDHEDAEPHFHDLAKLVRFAVDESLPEYLPEGGWHIPFIQDGDVEAIYDQLVYYKVDKMPENIINGLLKLSVARSARISYAPFDGNASIEREFERYDLLVGSEPLHASPAEHQAKVDTWKLASITYPNGPLISDIHFDNAKLSGNLGPGWIQYRKTLPNECFKGNW